MPILLLLNGQKERSDPSPFRYLCAPNGWSGWFFVHERRWGSAGGKSKGQAGGLGR